MTPERIRVVLVVGGQVQGVGFRYAARAVAERLGLGGWVRNLADGGVEIALEGPPAAVEEAAAWCHVGPPAARVSHVRRRAVGPIGERELRILATDRAARPS